MTEIKDKVQTFALNTWLSDYPSDMTYEQIVEALNKDAWTDRDNTWKEAGIVLSFIIENLHGEYAALRIRETFKRAMGLIGEVQRG
jgi:hypothetical protein